MAAALFFALAIRVAASIALAIIEFENAIILRWKNRQPKVKKELVFRYDGERPRRAWIPVNDLRARVPKQARRAHDNHRLRLQWQLVSMLGGASLGVIFGLMQSWKKISNGVVNDSVLWNVATMVLLVGTLGWILGKYVIAANMIPRPMWFIRLNEPQHLGEPWPLIAESVPPQDWAKYFEVLHREIEEIQGTETADKKISESARSVSPTARYDAVAMSHIEDMTDAKRVVQGWDPKKNAGAILKLTVIMVIAALGVIVFALIINDRGGV